MNKLVIFLQQNRLALTVLCFIGLLIVGSLFFRKTDDSNTVKRQSKFSIYKARFIYHSKQVYVAFMHFLSNIPIVGDIVSNITYGYRCQEALSEDDAVVRTGGALFYTCVTMVVATILSAMWFGDITIALIMGFILAHMVMHSMKSNPRRFLTNLVDVVEEFLLVYHKSSGNIDEAFHAVSRMRNPVAKHFDTMYEYIQAAYVSSTPEQVQAEYNTVAPSRFLRNLYAIIYMTYKYGDQINDHKSALNNNLMEIQEQINDSLYQQNKLYDDTMGERWFIILPVYFIPVLTWYMLEYFSFEGFEFIDTFCTSSVGYMVKVLCAVISLVCYMLYIKMVDRGVLEPKARSSWENKVLRNNYVRKVAHFLLPLDSPKRKKLQATIKKSGSAETVNALLIRRIFLAVMLCVIGAVSVGFNIVSNTNSIENDVYTGMAKDNYEHVIMTQNDVEQYKADMIQADRQVIKYLRHYDGYYQMTSDDQVSLIRSYMKESGVISAYRNYESYGISRIQSKMNQIADTRGVSNLLFVVLLTIFGFYIPVWLTYLQAFMNKDMLLMDEVGDLQRSTIMLMDYSSTTPDSLLTWYASSSMLLAPPFKECRITKDFDALKNAFDYRPYLQLTTSLEMAFNGLPLKEAFSGVEQRLLSQKKEQNRVMEKMLKFRIDTVEMFTSISMGAVIGLYMFMPLLVSMIQMFFSIGMF